MSDQQLTCDTCGRIGNRDDGIEPGGPCQEPCDGIVRAIPRFKAGDRVDLRFDKLKGSNSGSLVTIVRQLDAPGEADHEVGPMYEITLHVFEDEIEEADA